MNDLAALDADIRDFWTSTVAESRRMARAPRFEEYETRLRTVRVHDVGFSGFRGQEIRAWLIRPRHASGPLPTVVEYVGYGGGRGYAHENLLWASSGFAHLVMDVRGQGNDWRSGDTADEGVAGPGSECMLTRGIDSPDHYYYRRLFTDAVLAVDAARQLPGVDAGRIMVTGASQGGATAVAVAALHEDVVGLMSDVPAFASLREGIKIAEDGPYVTLGRYLSVHPEQVEDAFRVLRYFDTAVLARAARIPALFSLGGQDVMVPPETIRAIVAAYGGPAELVEYEFSGHEGGRAAHDARKVAWAEARIAAREEA